MADQTIVISDPNISEGTDVAPVGYRSPIICYNVSEGTNLAPVGYRSPIICYNVSEVVGHDAVIGPYPVVNVCEITSVVPVGSHASATVVAFSESAEHEPVGSHASTTVVAFSESTEHEPVGSHASTTVVAFSEGINNAPVGSFVTAAQVVNFSDIAEVDAAHSIAIVTEIIVCESIEHDAHSDSTSNIHPVVNVSDTLHISSITGPRPVVNISESIEHDAEVVIYIYYGSGCQYSVRVPGRFRDTMPRERSIRHKESDGTRHRDPQPRQARTRSSRQRS